MTRPGTQIIQRDQVPPRSTPPTETGVWFAVGATASGPADRAVLVRSLSSYEATFGPRSGGQLLYDCVETFFREGGAKVYIAAVPTTPSAVGAQTIDTTDLDTLTRSELDARAQAAGIEDPASLPNKEAVADAIRGVAADANSAAPRAATPTQLQAALDLFTADLGPGQVSIPGESDPALYDALLDHAQVTNRVALLDIPQGPNIPADLVALATALHDSTWPRYGALFGPWATIPGVAVGTSRTVPYSAIEAGIIARNDISLNPNIPAAGYNGRSAFATDLSERFTDLDYEQMNEAGVNMARLIYGGVETYGYRTLVDPTTDLLWRSFGNSRLNMAIVARAEVIAERYVFAQLDGRRKKTSQFGAELSAMLVPYYEGGALFGATADEAFFVDVGSQVNTDETMENGELHAVIRLRMSPFAELVVIEIVKVAMTEALAA